MNTRKQRRLGVEALEARLVLDSMGVAAGPPNADWQSVIVLLRDNVANPHAAAQALSVAHGGVLGHVYEHALKGFSAQLPAQAVAALAKNPQVKLVEQDLAMEAFADEPQVPTGVDRIDAEAAARPYVDVSDINIAIIDTGIQGIDLGNGIITGTHPDLNVVGGYNTTSLVTSAWNDGHGHGTHVAGIAAARGHWTEEGVEAGVVGVAPWARLWAVKVLNDRGVGKTSDIIEGIDWVTSTRMGDTNPDNDIHVANMSLGGTGVSTAYREAIQNSVAQGIVYVVAAGNSYRDIIGSDFEFGTSDDTIPAVYPEVATISAMADSDGMPGGLGDVPTSPGYADDTFADFSNFSNSDGLNKSWYFENNVVSSPGLGIDLMMPGVDILSTYKNSGYATMSGTSMAAPHAAGLAALYIARHDTAATDASGVYKIRQALINAARPWRSAEGLGDPGDYNPDSPDKHEEKLGYAGLVPTVTIDAPLDAARVSGSVAISATVEGNIWDEPVDQVECFINDVSIGDFTIQNGVWSFVLDTTTFSDGRYTIKATATVTTGTGDTTITKIGSDSITVVLDNVSDSTMTATLDLKAKTIRNNWQAFATVTVVDADNYNQPLENATVTGLWRYNSTVIETDEGTTDTNGEVVFQSVVLSKKVPSITFTVTDVALDGYEYTDKISKTITPDGTITSASLYTHLAAWQAIEALAAKPKDRILAPETVDFLMTLDG